VLVAAAALRIAWNKLLRRDAAVLVRAKRRLAQSDS
jgi:hypothetical protein